MEIQLLEEGISCSEEVKQEGLMVGSFELVPRSSILVGPKLTQVDSRIPQFRVGPLDE